MKTQKRAYGKTVKLEKGKILGVIDREMAQLTMQRVRDFLSATSASKLNSYGGATESKG